MNQIPARLPRGLAGAIAALALAGCGSGSAPVASNVPTLQPSSGQVQNDSGGSVDVGGQKRHYEIHLPPASTRLSPTPVVIAFHGSGDTIGRMRERTHLDSISDRHGFALVLPQGTLSPGNGLGWHVPGEVTGSSSADDVAFVRALIDEIGPKYRVDTSHVVATGLSNGGEMSQYLGCAMADRLLGIVAVAGGMTKAVAGECAPARPLSVVNIDGTSDPVVSTDGTGLDLASSDTLSLWVRVDGCAGQAVSEPLPDIAHDGTSVIRSAFERCAAGTSVSHYSVVGGGHAWPGGNPVGPVDQVGLTSKQFDAGEVVWQLLRERL